MNPTCVDAERLNAYFYGATPAAETNAIDEHVRSCRACELVLTTWKTEHDELKAAFEPLHARTPALAARVIAAVAREPLSRAETDRGEPRLSPGLLIGALLGAGLVAAAGLLVFAIEHAQADTKLEHTRQELTKAIDEGNRARLEADGRLSELEKKLVRSQEEQAKERAELEARLKKRDDELTDLTRKLDQGSKERADLLAKLSKAESERDQLAARPVPTTAVARLALATGSLETLEGRGGWRPLATGASIEAGTRVRTVGKAKASFDCADGSEVRLNGETELEILAARQIDLKHGEIFTKVAKDDKIRFEVRTEVSRIEAKGTSLDISHSPQKSLTEPAVTTLHVVEGVAQVGSATIDEGFSCELRQGRPVEASRSYQLSSMTRWVNEILALKGGENAEFQQRVNGMLAEIGQSKMQFLDDTEIRSLGDHCALPLARFVQSPDSRGRASQRRRAARILSDVASASSTGDMAFLLSDPDPEVRVAMGRGLERVTGQRFGYDDAYWRGDKFEEGVRRWETFLGAAGSPWAAPPRRAGGGKD